MYVYCTEQCARASAPMLLNYIIIIIVIEHARGGQDGFCLTDVFPSTWNRLPFLSRSERERKREWRKAISEPNNIIRACAVYRMRECKYRNKVINRKFIIRAAYCIKLRTYSGGRRSNVVKRGARVNAEKKKPLFLRRTTKYRKKKIERRRSVYITI